MNDAKAKGVNICRNICSLTDELRDLWLRKQSVGDVNSFMNLTVSQHRMLRAVWRLTSSRPEGIMLRDLAEKLGLSSSAVSVMVENMVQRGYLIRTVAQSDRRKVLIRLTDVGISECDGGNNFFGDISREFIDNYDPEKFDVFEEVVSDFIKFLADKNGEKK
ncbi:MAG: MarR family transcriptional regulator [Lentisphaerae bacterium]|nr:MarR family transcriptional regulator [Lentisphaerota bacterium]